MWENAERVVFISVLSCYGDLTQNTTATATRTSPNKRFDEQNNGCATPRQNVCACVNFDVSGLHIFLASCLFSRKFYKV